MVHKWYSYGMGRSYGMQMVHRWYESLVPYEENYFLKTKNFVWYTDGMHRSYGMQMVDRWYELIVPYTNSNKKI